MLGDIKVFLTLMVLFMVAHGVLINSFTNSVEPYLGIFKMLWDIFYLPYFQIYGELFMENIENENTDVRNFQMFEHFCTNSTRIITPAECCFQGAQFNLAKVNIDIRNTYPDKEELEMCGVRNDRITVTLTAIYMMLANVIMLNILIAIFNFRYESVQKHAGKISAYLRFV